MTIRKWIGVAFALLSTQALLAQAETGKMSSPEAARARLIVLADMGNEPDEVQQMMHLLMYANEVEIEGLIAVTGKYLRPEHKVPYRQELHPELFTELIEGYAKVYPNLKLHADGWPTPEHLHSVVVSGQRGYGIADVAEGKASEGSKLITEAVTKTDPRPVHIVVNAGANTLAQALRDYRAAHSPEELTAFVAKLRVFENGAQDNSGAWICHEFPDVFWVRSNYQTYCYGGPSNADLGPHTWKPYAYSAEGQDVCAKENVRTNHGALGERFPVRSMGNKIHFMEGGGTIPWMGLVCHGLGDASDPSWGNWSGRFSAAKLTNVWSRHKDIKADEQGYVPFAVYTEAADRWTDPQDGKVYEGNNVPVWRWRAAMWNDFKARMDWCIQPYAKANHPPHAVLNGDKSDAILKLAVRAGETVSFTAAGSSDPDHDALRFAWWHYQEAGRKPYGKKLPIDNSTSSQVTFTVPEDAAGREIHLILEVQDQSDIAPLVDYRRVVIDVEKSAKARVQHGDLYPSWAPRPDKPRAFTGEEIAFIRQCADNEHMEFDPERGVLLGGGTKPKKGLVRWSIEYATVLMDAEDEAKFQRAFNILKITLPTQQRDPGGKHHGNFPELIEEPIVPGKRFDVNQAEFIAMALQEILHRHEQRLPQPMKDQIREALLLSAEHIKSRSNSPTYTNVYFMDILNLLSIGEHYNRPDLVDKGLEYLRTVRDLTLDQGSYTEYQSPNYTIVVLDVLYHLLAWVENPEARSMGLELYRETWRQIATQYHPPSRQWAGPQLRNRGGEEILSDGKAWMIRRAVEGGTGLPPDTVRPSRKTVDLVRLSHRVPDDLRASFLTLPAAKEVVQSYFSLTPVSRKFLPDDYGKQHGFVSDTIGTTWLHPKFALGTVNRGHFAPDRRGIMAHWGTPENAGAMILQFYKDGVPFCAPQHFGVQKQGRALYAVNIATNGGDTHWFFDRIKGSFRAKDLRLRFEFIGIGKDAKIRIIDKEARIAEVVSGELTFRIHVPVALFDGNEIEMKTGRPLKDRKTLDLVLHAGGEKSFDLRGFADTVVGIALAVDTGTESTSFANLKSPLDNHRLTLDWEGLHLSIPTRPATDIALQKSFKASVDGESRKLKTKGTP